VNSRVGIIQDYDDKKKQYHNLEKDYVVHGERGRFLISRPQSACENSIRIPMVNTTEDQYPTRRRQRFSSETGLNVTCRHQPGTLSPQPLEERVRERAAPTIPSRG
jgi:hypothetical protein